MTQFSSASALIAFNNSDLFKFSLNNKDNNKAINPEATKMIVIYVVDNFVLFSIAYV